MTGCQTSSQKNLQTAQTGLATAQTQASQFATGQAESILPNVGNFLNTLVSGDTNAIMGLLQPQISSLSQQYAQAETASAEFAPRGGGRTAAVEEAPFQEANQISTLVNTERQNAVGEAGQLGLGELSGGTTAAATASSSLETAQSQANEAVQQQQQAGESIGALLSLLVAA